MKVALVTGGFDPIHSGHIEMIRAAREHGEQVWVGLNSDEWLVRKKGFVFMPLQERVAIVEALDGVDRVISWEDSDGTASGAIFKALSMGASKVAFCNGGDRSDVQALPKEERLWASHPNCELVFGVGGTDKRNSSSTLVENIQAPKTMRPWGYYKVVFESEGVKVKELVVDPGQKLSMQRHTKRSEFWMVYKGHCVVNTPDEKQEPTVMGPMQSTFIPNTMWHQLMNPFPEPCHVVEIQYGKECVEEDIERWEE